MIDDIESINADFFICLIKTNLRSIKLKIEFKW